MKREEVGAFMQERNINRRRKLERDVERLADSAVDLGFPKAAGDLRGVAVYLGWLPRVWKVLLPRLLGPCRSRPLCRLFRP